MCYWYAVNSIVTATSGILELPFALEGAGFGVVLAGWISHLRLSQGAEMQVVQNGIDGW